MCTSVPVELYATALPDDVSVSHNYAVNVITYFMAYCTSVRYKNAADFNMRAIKGRKE